MLGTKPRAFSSHPSICLDQLVPQDDFYRFLDARLDLSFVRDWVEQDYAPRGRPSVDPVVFFKLQLVLFFEGLRSERQLMRVVADRLSLRWYVGYDFGEPLPDHSSLTRIRDRYGREIFQRFFDRIVELCRDAELIWGEELIFDATKVRANADIDSLVPRFAWRAKQHLDDLFAEEAAPATGEQSAHAGTAEAPEPAPLALPDRGPSDVQALLTEENNARTSWLDQHEHDPTRSASGSYQRTSDLRVSATDPDATPMTEGKHTVLGYQDHYVVDGGKHRIVLAALVLPGDVRENTPMPDLASRVCFRWQLRPKRAIGDGAYGTGENLRALEELGMRAYMPIVDRESDGPFYKRADFRYEAERDVYICPQGTPLKARGNSYVTRVRVFQAPAAACQAWIRRTSRACGSPPGRT
jgi:transposase